MINFLNKVGLLQDTLFQKHGYLSTYMNSMIQQYDLVLNSLCKQWQYFHFHAKYQITYAFIVSIFKCVNRQCFDKCFIRKIFNLILPKHFNCISVSGAYFVSELNRMSNTNVMYNDCTFLVCKCAIISKVFLISGIWAFNLQKKLYVS